MRLILAGGFLAWAGVSIVVAVAIGRACRIADDMTRRVLAAAQNPDRAPNHPSQALYVQDILDAAVQS